MPSMWLEGRKATTVTTVAPSAKGCDLPRCFAPRLLAVHNPVRRGIRRPSEAPLTAHGYIKTIGNHLNNHRCYLVLSGFTAPMGLGGRSKACGHGLLLLQLIICLFHLYTAEQETVAPMATFPTSQDASTQRVSTGGPRLPKPWLSFGVLPHCQAAALMHTAGGRTELTLCECEPATGAPNGLSCEKEGWFISSWEREGSWVRALALLHVEL